MPALATVKFRRDVLPDGQRTNQVEAWGSWVEVRTEVEQVLTKALDKGQLDGARIFMSPVADVYWPGEKERRITRRILELLAKHPVFDWLLISTRSGLVERDVDVLQQLANQVEVGFSIPTDREDVKAVLGRRNPSLAIRFEAAQALMKAGIPTRIHVAPLQPHSDDFAARLADSAHWVWVDWHQHFAAGFRDLFSAHGWQPSTPDEVRTFADQLRSVMGRERVKVGQAHFVDRWSVINSSRGATQAEVSLP